MGPSVTGGKNMDKFGRMPRAARHNQNTGEERSAGPPWDTLRGRKRSQGSRAAGNPWSDAGGINRESLGRTERRPVRPTASPTTGSVVSIQQWQCHAATKPGAQRKAAAWAWRPMFVGQGRERLELIQEPRENCRHPLDQRVRTSAQKATEFSKADKGGSGGSGWVAA